MSPASHKTASHKTASPRQPPAADFKQVLERDLLLLELSLHEAEKTLHNNDPAAGWQQVLSESWPLLKRLDMPGVSAEPAVGRLRKWLYTLTGDLLLALIAQAWQADAHSLAQRWLVQATLQLKNVSDYPARERHQKLLGDWRQKLKKTADPAAALQKLLTKIEDAASKIRAANLSEARSLFALLRGKLQQLRKLQDALTTPLEVNLADELEQELSEHIAALEQRERERQHASDFFRLQSTWPRQTKDQATAQAYRLITICKTSSDQVDRPGWDALENAFDQQNARRMLLRAVEQVRSNSSRSMPLRLTDAAVRLDPSLAPVAAVLLGATAFSWLDQSFPNLRADRERLLEQGRTLAKYSHDPGTTDHQNLRAELLQETNAFLRRLSSLLIRQASQTDDARLAARRNARELTRALTPLVRYGSVADLRIAAQIVDHWRKVLPDTFDPRHPLHVLHRRLQIQQRIVEASHLLGHAANEVGAVAADYRTKAQALARDAIQLGIDQWRPLREAIRMYGIAQFTSINTIERELQVRHLMHLVTTAYSSVRGNSPEQKREWFQRITLLTVDRWIQQSISALQRPPEK